MGNLNLLSDLKKVLEVLEVLEVLDVFGVLNFATPTSSLDGAKSGWHQV